MSQSEAVLIAALIGIIAGWVAWWLRARTDSWFWSRQQKLDAVIALLEAVDQFSLHTGKVWSSGSHEDRRDEDWVRRADAARDELGVVDQATGRVRLVANRETTERSLDLYVACDRLFRRAIAIPPEPAARFQEAANGLANEFDRLIDVARRDIRLAARTERWRRNETIYQRSARLLAGLNESDPDPRVRGSDSTGE